MIRAVTYTLLFSGMSAGAAVALVVVLDSGSSSLTATTGPAPLPEAAHREAPLDVRASVVPATVEPVVTPEPKTAAVRPVPKKTKMQSLTDMEDFQETVILRTPPVITLSTRNSPLGPNDTAEADSLTQDDVIARTSTWPTTRKVVPKPADISSTWNTGVYR